MPEEQEFQRRGLVIGDATLNPSRDISRRATPTPQTRQQLDPMWPVLRDQISETQLVFPVTTQVSLLLPGSKLRRTYLLIVNLDSANMCWLGFGFTPAANIGIPLIPLGNYEPWKIPQGEIYIIGAAALNVALMYGTQE